MTILYTAPTAIRAFMKWGDEYPTKHDLSSLRLLGTVGEPINPEAWIWYHENIGGGRCPIVDTWWQTETGAIMITPLPGVTATEARVGAPRRSPASTPRSSTLDGQVVPEGGGFLAIRRPWPSMLRAHLGRRRALQADVLEQVARRSARTTRSRGALFPRRRRPARRATATSGSSAASTTC